MSSLVDRESAIGVNLQTLQRKDSYIASVLYSARHSVLYELQNESSWVRRETEGPLFIVQRNPPPTPGVETTGYYQMYILNRKSWQDWFVTIDAEMAETAEIQDKYLFFQHGDEVLGVWFYETQDVQQAFAELQRVAPIAHLRPPPPGPVPTKTTSSSSPAAAPQPMVKPTNNGPAAHTTPASTRSPNPTSNPSNVSTSPAATFASPSTSTGSAKIVSKSHPSVHFKGGASTSTAAATTTGTTPNKVNTTTTPPAATSTTTPSSASFASPVQTQHTNNNVVHKPSVPPTASKATPSTASFVHEPPVLSSLPTTSTATPTTSSSSPVIASSPNLSPVSPSLIPAPIPMESLKLGKYVSPHAPPPAVEYHPSIETDDPRALQERLNNFLHLFHSQDSAHSQQYQHERSLAERIREENKRNYKMEQKAQRASQREKAKALRLANKDEEEAGESQTSSVAPAPAAAAVASFPTMQNAKQDVTLHSYHTSAPPTSAANATPYPVTAQTIPPAVAPQYYPPVAAAATPSPVLLTPSQLAAPNVALLTPSHLTASTSVPPSTGLMHPHMFPSAPVPAPVATAPAAVVSPVPLGQVVPAYPHYPTPAAASTAAPAAAPAPSNPSFLAAPLLSKEVYKTYLLSLLEDQSVLDRLYQKYLANPYSHPFF